MGPPLRPRTWASAPLLLALAGGGVRGAGANANATATDLAPVRFNLTLTPLDAVFDTNPSHEQGSKYTGDWIFTAGTANGSVVDQLGMAASSAIASCSAGPPVPQLVVDFTGDAYYLYGKAPDGATQDDFAILVNGTHWLPEHALQDGIVGVVKSLGWNLQSTLFSPLKGGPWDIESLVLTTEIMTQAPTFADLLISEVPFLSAPNELNGWFNWTGNWTALSNLPSPDGDSGPSYSHAYGNNDSVVTFDVPTNTTFLVLNGTTGPDHNQWTFKLTPRDGRETRNQTVNAKRPFRSTGRVAFFQLDPTEQYMAEARTFSQKTDQEWLPWDQTAGGLGSVLFYSALSNVKRPSPDSSSSRKLSTGGIVGVAVGGAVGLIIVLLAAWFFCCRRRARKKPDRKSMPLSFDIVHHPSDETYPRQSPDALVSKEMSPGTKQEWEWTDRKSAPFDMPPQPLPQSPTHRSLDHRSLDHRSLDHRSLDHRSLDHRSLDHRSLEHRSQDHPSLDHRSLDHASLEHRSLDYQLTLPNSVGEPQSFMSGLNGEATYPLMTSDVSHSSLNHYLAASPASTYPLPHEPLQERHPEQLYEPYAHSEPLRETRQQSWHQDAPHSESRQQSWHQQTPLSELRQQSWHQHTPPHPLNILQPPAGEARERRPSADSIVGAQLPRTLSIMNPDPTPRPSLDPGRLSPDPSRPSTDQAPPSSDQGSPPNGTQGNASTRGPVQSQQGYTDSMFTTYDHHVPDHAPGGGSYEPQHHSEHRYSHRSDFDSHYYEPDAGSQRTRLPPRV